MNIVKAFFHPLENLRDRLHAQYYEHIHILDGAKNQPRWRGIKIVKYPNDMLLYAQVIFDKKPDFIIETGTYHGGSALFFADIMAIYGGKQVISVDVRQIDEQEWMHMAFPEHPLLTCVKGSSTNGFLVESLKDYCKGTVMVILDSAHNRLHVQRELELYSPLVSPGQYLVVEDCYAMYQRPHDPYYAVKDFLRDNDKFERHPLEEQFIFAVTRGGWLYRKP